MLCSIVNMCENYSFLKGNIYQSDTERLGRETLNIETEKNAKYRDWKKKKNIRRFRKEDLKQSLFL